QPLDERTLAARAERTYNRRDVVTLEMRQKRRRDTFRAAHLEAVDEKQYTDRIGSLRLYHLPWSYLSTDEFWPGAGGGRRGSTRDISWLDHCILVHFNAQPA